MLAYFLQVEQDAQLGKTSANLQITGLRVQRNVNQALLRIDALKAKEDTAPGQVTKDTNAVTTQQATVDTLVTQIAGMAQTSKSYAQVYSHAKKVVNLVQRFTKKYGDATAPLESGQNFAAMSAALTVQVQTVQGQIDALTAQHQSLTQTIDGINNQIAGLNDQIDGLQAKVAAQNDALKALNAQNASVKGNATAKADLKAQKLAVEQVIADLKTQIQGVQGQIAQLRTSIATQKDQLTTVNGQIQAAREQMTGLKQQIREDNLLAAIFKQLA